MYIYFQTVNTDKLTTFVNTINGKEGSRWVLGPSLVTLECLVLKLILVFIKK